MESLREIRSAGKVVYLTKPEPNKEFLQSLENRTASAFIDVLLSEADKKTASEIIARTAKKLGIKTSYILNHTVDTLVSTEGTILPLMETVFDVLDKKASSEITLKAAEKLGMNIFDGYVKEKVTEWTTKTWTETIARFVFNPQGTGIVFSEISKDRIVAHVIKCPTPGRAGKAPHLTCPFSYGYARGLWKKAFLEGEVLMGGTMAHGAPTCGFTFYVKADKEHAEMREKIKRYLTKEEEMELL
ncbi:MAG: hypothetical protein KJ886_01700 [Candidatus Thermoplasmatota archaeon]|nr:hypothetical protein [Candidatus Thermoplasmatota archaeon]MBU4256686.1 hypothetical protein [Candidatus Thermoplasmatota archaeon]